MLLLRYGIVCNLTWARILGNVHPSLRQDMLRGGQHVLVSHRHMKGYRISHPTIRLDGLNELLHQPTVSQLYDLRRFTSSRLDWYVASAGDTDTDK
jgi:hypothetical protein